MPLLVDILLKVFLALVALLLAGIVVGLAHAFVAWLRRPPEACEHEVREVAERYRQAYREETQEALRDHIYGARLARATRHRRLLIRAAAIIRAQDGRTAPLRNPLLTARPSPRRDR